MLDELVDEIEKLKSRISNHRDVLQGSEAQTRMSLIDPLLQVLGWDTSDPALVRPEYHLGAGRADYVLLDSNEKELAIIEAKKLGERLSSQHREQAIVYAHRRGVRFPILTNGSDWEVYDQSDFVPNVPIEDRPLLNISIDKTPSHKSALQLLLLWRPNLASGQPIEASEPIMGTELETPVVAMPNDSPEPAMPDVGWVTLRDVPTTPGTSRTRPSAISFPNGEKRRITIWLDFLVEVAEWLIRDGVLTPDNCPIPDVLYPDSFYLINSTPRHPDGTDFYSPRKLSNGLFLYTRGTAKFFVNRSTALIEHCGKDPATVYVQVG